MSRNPRIFDCFTFSTELDLLEFRLELLGSTVDRFVIVEAPRTFSGLEKPLLFQDNRSRFAAHLDKIVHVVVDDLPPPIPDRWVPDRFQRNAITRGLDEAEPDDLVIVSDADEIPDPAVLEELRVTAFETAGLRMRLCYYAANWESATAWPLAKVSRKRSLGQPDALRQHPDRLQVPEAGSHFSYLFDPPEIARKYSWFAHSELDEPRQRSAPFLGAMVDLAIFAPTGEALEVRSPGELGAVQRALLTTHPELFVFDPPPGWARRLGLGWQHLRRRGALPQAGVEVGDAAVGALAGGATRRGRLR